MKITHIVVHYSATFEDQPITAADIDTWHRGRGFKGIGYHFFYRLDGTEEVGRPVTEQGAHVANQNRGKLGLCFAGGLRRATGKDTGVNTLNRAQEISLISRIRELKKAHPSAIVCGHKDLMKTQCPAFDVPKWWSEVEKDNYRPVFNPDPVVATAPMPKTNPFVEFWKKLLGRG
jgi:N-acetylmuramoyl-L-alanine amidase